MGIATLAEGVSNLYADKFGWLPPVVSGATVVVLLLALPWLLTRMWSTTSMAGSLRERLAGAAARHQIRFNSILIWQTHHAVNNAAVVGYLPFSRYFMMTDALLESLTDDQIEAVFAHEIGHAKMRHIWFYLITIVACLMAAIGLSALAGMAIKTTPAWMQMGREDVIGVIQLFLLAGMMILLFGPISRRFENEADWFACRHMGEVATRPEKDENGMTVMKPAGIAGGAELFSSALVTLIELSNRDTRKGNWTHPSPASRVELVRTMAVNPAAVEAFEKRRWWTRAWIAALLVASAAILAAAILAEHWLGNS
jgi:Zn-dependent protease with chaperone function